MKLFPSLFLTLSLATGLWAEEAKPAETKEVIVDGADELAAALGNVTPGQTILVRTGTYRGIFTIQGSGAAGRPVTIRPLGDGPVTIAKPADVTFTPTSRQSASGPNLERTIRIPRSTDIVIKDFHIEGGVLIGNPNSLNETDVWKETDKAVESWLASNDGREAPPAARKIAEMKWIRTVAYLRGRIGPGFVGWMDGKMPPTAQRITVENCDITWRGVALWQAGACRIVKNRIHDVEEANCGILLQFLCMHNEIVGNDVSGMYDPKCHWHGEGIRLVNGACYNLVADNYVHDIRGMGFGIATDLFCDFNTIINNRVENIQNIAFTAQAWDSDNKWVNNVAERANIGFEFSSWWWDEDPGNQPTTNCEIRGNEAKECINADLVAARVNGYRFVNNNFKAVHFSPLLVKTFASGGSLWNGSSTLPDGISTEPPKRDLRFEY